MSGDQVAAWAGVTFPVVLVEMDWPTGLIRAHSARGIIRWAGVSWTGVGRFGEIQLPEEMSGLAAFAGEIALHGLTEELLDEVELPVRNRPARIWIGALAARDTPVLKAEPIEIFGGYVEAAPVSVEREGADVVHVARVSLGVGPSARAAGGWQHTFENQSRLHPGDTAGRHVIRARDEARKTTWPED